MLGIGDVGSAVAARVRRFGKKDVSDRKKAFILGGFCTAQPETVGSGREPKLKEPLKLDVDSFESRLARSLPPNFRKCLPRDIEV